MANNEGEQVTTIKPDANASNSEVENLKSQLLEAQRKITEQSEELKTQSQYVRQADTVAQLISANPKLKDELRKTYQQHYGGGVVASGEESDQQKDKEPTKKNADGVENPQIEQLSREVGEIKKNTRSKTIKDFEEASGISGLPDEQKKEIRKKIESYVNTFGQSVGNVPLEMLPEVLDKAHKAINVEQMVQEGRMEGMAELYRNQSGAIPHIQGRRLEPETNEELTEAQVEWAQKLGVSVDKVKDVVKDKDTETTRKSAAEIKKEQRDRGE